MTLDAYLTRAAESGEAPPRPLRTSETLDALIQEGMSVIRHDLRRASALATAARRLARSLRDPRSIGCAARLSGHAELLAGRAKRAVPHYVLARSAFEEIPEERAATAVAMLQALAYVGDYTQAFEVAEDALAYFRSIGDAFRAARVEANLANALHRLDRLHEARAHYESAVRVLVDAGATADLAIVTRNFGVCLMGLFEFEAAARLYAASRKHFESEGLSSLVYEVDLNLAYLLGRQGELRRALEMYRDLREELPDDLGFELGHCFLDQADFMLESGLWTDACRAARQAAAIFEKLGAKFELGKAQLINGLSSIRLGNMAEGRIALREARRRLRTDLNLNWRSLVDVGYAELWRVQGSPRQAFRALINAEQGGLTPERLPLVQQELADLALDLGELSTFERLSVGPALHAKRHRLAGEHEAAEAFARSALSAYDAARNQLEASRLRQAAAQARARELSECFRSLRNPLERLGVVVRLKNQALAELTQSREVLPRYRSEEELHEARNLAPGRPVPTKLPHMPAGERFVEFFSDGEQLRAFLIDPEAVSELALGEVEFFERLARQFRFQLGRDRSEQGRGAVAMLAKLADVFAPIAEGAERLIIGRDKPVHMLPFHALFPHKAVHYAPSAATWAALEGRPSVASGALVIGSSDLDAPLIDTEAVRIAEQLGTQPVRAEMFDQLAPNAAWIHLAAHGVAREDRPLLSAMRLSDRDLAALDIVGMRLGARLVTLSGCSTGVSNTGEFDDAEGFIEAFFVAGVQSVLASLWPVSDEATLHFMEAFYSKSSLGLPIAFRDAMALTQASFPHPADWAAFALFGRP